MIDHVLTHTVPAGYAVLPPAMESPRATALVLAIGLQESRFLNRRQLDDGPARGFWQFEQNGVRGIVKHPSSRAPLAAALRALRYERLLNKVVATQLALEHNDTLAFVFARLALWTLAGSLPGRGHADAAWRQYIAAWNPGDPKPETWAAFFEEAWERTEPVRDLVGRPSS
jgi:hypothetical protein